MATSPSTPVIRPGATVSERVGHVLSLIRPAVQADGGDIELVDVTPDGVARIRLHGACVGCPSSRITLQVGVERNLKAHIPEIKGVQAVE
jgi:Fe-S cluster biogenesis protein NfuA